MRITNNMVTNSVLSELQQLDTQQSSLQAEVSSGLAVTQPSDDPAVFGQVIQEEGQSSQLAQYSKNAAQALNLAQSSYSGLNSLTQIYDSATQIATSGTGTLGAGAASGYADELNQLIEQAVTVANSQYNGNYLYAGTAVDKPPFQAATDSNGNITSVTYAGNSSQAAIPLSPTSSVAPTTSGATNLGLADMLNNMIAARDALNGGDPATISKAATQLNASEEVLSSAAADNGAVQLSIQSEQTQEQSASMELTSLMSSQTNADLPTTITKLDQTQLAYQAAMETAAKILQLSITQYIT